ncbi:hypothetical protein ACLQ24_09380 [Micromonospora sp. DT4]|uniref:hypothetical protein n=1 Tax=Micromonospora sp. DT4 TaxID=3393438 RepID=UPI003CE92516
MISSSTVSRPPTTAAQIAAVRCQLSGSASGAGAASAPTGGLVRVPSRLDTARYGLTTP